MSSAHFVDAYNMLADPDDVRVHMQAVIRVLGIQA